MPRNTKIPERLEDWFTIELFEKIFPYAAASNVFTHDKKPFWDYISFINSIKWMNNHKDTRFHNFCNNGDELINKYEMAAFLANTHQETGDPSIKIPYPWLWPSPPNRNGPEYDVAGGMLAIMEGCCSMVAPHPTTSAAPFKGDLNSQVPLTSNTRYLIGLSDKESLAACVLNLKPVDQPNFGLGAGTGGGVVFQDGLAAVSDNGTVYGDIPTGTDANIVKPTKECIKSTTDRRFAALGPYCQYGGRGAIQLSYNFNYSWTSLELFNDYRLIRFPNLIITTDRIKFNGLPYYFGFPGPNEGGNNQLPLNISSTTPPARMMAYITAICFWMLPRSGRSISCHECMLQPTKIGITGVNLIVNNDSGCKVGTWAYNKNIYYKRICNIFNIDSTPTLICPPFIK